MCSSDIFLGVLAILFPPIAVWVKCGICSVDSVINILLCCLGFIPGLLHAWYIIAKYPDPAERYDAIPQDAERGHRVVYVVHGGAPKNGSAGQQGPQGYGTTAPMAPHQQQQPGGEWAGEGSSSVPPTYQEAVAGDHKVQTK